jgi:ABC-type Fe3+/spermidine/putrescine transport system ATPase subunit
LRVRKIDKAERERRVYEALEMVRLENLGERFPSQMSGGHQHRVALARALVIRPDVLLLDEPLSNLDAQLRLEMRTEIKRLHEQTGTTALYVTHDQEEALSIADRVAVLKEGVLQQVGAPRELYRRPASRFVAEFIGETNLIPGQLKTLNGDNCEVETPLGVLHATCPESKIEVGSNVQCSIRPESLRVNDEQENQLSARLENVMYLGANEQYQVRLTGGRQNGETENWRDIKIAIANPQAAPPQAGSTLTLSCAPEDIVVLSE